MSAAEKDELLSAMGFPGLKNVVAVQYLATVDSPFWGLNLRIDFDSAADISIGSTWLRASDQSAVAIARELGDAMPDLVDGRWWSPTLALPAAKDELWKTTATPDGNGAVMLLRREPARLTMFLCVNSAEQFRAVCENAATKHYVNPGFPSQGTIGQAKWNTEK